MKLLLSIVAYVTCVAVRGKKNLCSRENKTLKGREHCPNFKALYSNHLIYLTGRVLLLVQYCDHLDYLFGQAFRVILKLKHFFAFVIRRDFYTGLFALHFVEHKGLILYPRVTRVSKLSLGLVRVKVKNAKVLVANQAKIAHLIEQHRILVWLVADFLNRPIIGLNDALKRKAG